MKEQCVHNTHHISLEYLKAMSDRVENDSQADKATHQILSKLREDEPLYPHPKYPTHAHYQGHPAAPIKQASQHGWPLDCIKVSDCVTMLEAMGPTKIMPMDGPAAIQAPRPAAGVTSRAL